MQLTNQPMNQPVKNKTSAKLMYWAKAEKSF